MKALTTAGLTKLIQLIKSSFISNTDTVTTNTVTLATVATSGSYNDLSNKPTIPDAQVQADWDVTDTTSKAYIKNKPYIPSGVVIDQTYDGTSTNAQSGVAIAGAGFVQNMTTVSNSINIGGDASSYSFCTNIGVFSQVGNVSCTALGYNTNASGVSSICIGNNASASASSAIQIGKGTNSTANTLQVGFSYANTNYQLLDGATGLIPDARVSTNIARTSQIPTVPTNVSAFTNDSGYQTSSDVNTIVTNAISTLLGNLYPVGSVYIGTQSTCPLETLISGSTWQLVSSGKVLQGADSSHAAGTTIAAGLPEISGSITSRSYTTQYSGAIISASGAFSYTRNAASGTTSPVSVTGTAVKADVTQFHASNSNSIYGNSTTVQPPAYAVNIWERTA